ncbi:hypothetical protein BABINDRAFT_161957 [Babjeviella inositovora NRRL Y-12698]|uniref:Vacuolar protein sorting-associated protein n=1 Tax=Babjeviella inositovora NRRL Y-12698 TaxID=984486 RepID=A0A1E3QPI4_9ASCO|nr:uncharacterized protein BABINDRAFT_161957 [Babjeviella inositovora NRRL Y-12698]ODQ79571.1 hypothetical protein BABINDRAFT_161957 [Babjeviella inositovora NRRL Y-12698]
MLESVAATLLNRFIGAYVENFDPKQLNIGIWSGDVKLRNLRLKKESLDRFQLPVNVTFGHIGELTLQIPWSNLKSKPVKITIEDVYLLASPSVEETYDPEEALRRENLVKQDKLRALELAETAKPNSDAQTESFTEGLVTKIVDNVQITIKNIHLRYEDKHTFTETPYAVGVTLNELSVLLTDTTWVPSFILITQQLTHKLMILKALSCYWSTDMSSIHTDDPEELLRTFQALVERQNASDVSQTQFILRPVLGTGRLTINKAGTTEKHPHIKAELFFDEFGIDLDADQYRDMLWTMSKYNWYAKTLKFRQFRPTLAVGDAPREWFRYAAKAVLHEIHEKNYKWSWEFFQARRDQRIQYIAVWKLKLATDRDPNYALSEEKTAELVALESLLAYEDIKFYRSLARSQFRKDAKVDLLGTVSSASSASTQTQGSGWFSWWSKPETSSDPDSLHITEEQRQELYDAIDYDQEAIIEAVSIPRERVKVELLATLKKGGILIRRKRFEPSLAEVVFEGCTTQLYQRPDSFLAKFQLQEFRVEDGTETTMYKHIVSVKPIHTHGDTNDPQDPSPFFKVSFENNPLDGLSDSVVLAKLRSMTVFYNPVFVEAVVRFFTPPRIHMDTIGMIMNAAELTVEGLTQQTRIGLEYALDGHKTLDAKLDLQAPLIILPLEPTSWQSPVAVLDAGHISVISDLVERAKIDDIKAKDAGAYTAADWTQLNELMYDKFNLHLQDAQFLIGPNIKDTIDQLHAESGVKPALIMDRLNLKLLLEVSILPEAYTLAKVRVGGEIPRFKVSLSDFQYKTLMQIIDKCVPTFEEEDLPVENIFTTFGGQTAYPIELSDSEGSTSDSEESASNRGAHDRQVSNRTAHDNDASHAQHLFEFNFKVESVCVSMLQTTPTGTVPLVDIVGDHFLLAFVKTAQAMTAKVTLTDINVLDHVGGVGEFKQLLSSNSFATDRKQNIFTLDYERAQRMVEFKGREIEVWDQDIAMNIATVRLVVTRTSVLTVINYCLDTFTDPNPPPEPADALRHNSADVETSPQKIVLNMALESIIVVLNDDGLKLATLQLSRADVRVFMVPESMKVYAKLGALTVHDELNTGSPRDSLLRELISIDGSDLAELTYETLDPETNPHAHTSTLVFEAGSLRVNFVEEPLSAIYRYMAQFQKMKELYDGARAAALNLPLKPEEKMLMDVRVRTPIIVFPVASLQGTYDDLTVYLGEFYASNEFVRGSNVITTGIKNTRLTSLFHFALGQQALQVIENLDIAFTIDIADEQSLTRASTIISGKIPDTELKLSEVQLAYIMRLARILPQAFSIDEPLESGDVTEVPLVAVASTLKAAPAPPSPALDLPQDHVSIDLRFAISRLSLTIYHETRNVCSVADLGLSRFALNDTGVVFVQRANGHFKADLHVRSFTVEDVRLCGDNKFTEIIPPISHDTYQFMAAIHTEGAAMATVVSLSIDSPKVIVALDYIFALKAFADAAFGEDEWKIEDETKDVAKTTPAASAPVYFTVNVVDAFVVLLADPSTARSEAIVFKLEKLLVSSQHVTSVVAKNVGMFLCHMDRFEERLRLIDDFGANLTIDARGSSSTSLLQTVTAAVEPVVMRLSLRDIRLALKVFQRATELYEQLVGQPMEEPEEEIYTTFTKEFRKKLSKYAPTIVSHLSHALVSGETTVIVRGEELLASFAGLRLVVIGDVHELPVLDMNVKPFDVAVRNWSTNLQADTKVVSYVNIYNYARSCWEPLVEPWPLTVHAARERGTLAVDLVSRELVEMSMTSRSIALLAQIQALIAQDVELKPRGEDMPYEILNQTGYDVKVWVDGATTQTLIRDGEEIPWQFEDWEKVRENLSVDTHDVLAVQLVGSMYAPVSGISVVGEGEELFVLSPPVDGVHDRLACEVILGPDKVKSVVLRSTITVRNDTNVALIIGMGLEKATAGELAGLRALREFTIQPGAFRAVPIDSAYREPIAVRPSIDSFHWSENRIFWEHLLAGPVSLKCPSARTDDRTCFYFQSSAQYDEVEPLARLYPHMTVVISAPLEIENLLPFDLAYRLYDKNSKKDWKNTLTKGTSSHVHVVRLEHFLLLSVRPLGSGYDNSEFAIVNSPAGSEFRPERVLTVRHESGQKVHLRIHYAKKVRGTGMKLVVYSPYVVLNRTGENLVLAERANQMISKVEPGLRVTERSSERSLELGAVSDPKTGDKHETEAYGSGVQFVAAPTLFSFDQAERKCRATLRFDDSVWSGPISLDAIGQATSVTIPLVNKLAERNVGITVVEGEGKYQLSKVVTIAPRYVFKNNTGSTVRLLETGQSKPVEVLDAAVLPLYRLRRTSDKSLMMSFTGAEAQWSAPFGINDVGQIFLKVLRPGSGHVLLKISVLLEDATLFVQVDDAGSRWPFSVRNFSNTEFIFFQSNPNIDENDEVVRRDYPFKPIYYKIPPKSVMPYAWDYPAGVVKELVLRSHGRERHVLLVEIGASKPMVLPAVGELESATVDLNVVADGPVQALVISEYDPEQSMFKARGGDEPGEARRASGESQRTSETGEASYEAVEKDERYFTKCIVRLEGLGISLMNTKLQELCYVTFRGLELRYNELELYQTLSMKLKWIQVDNQLYGGVYPIVVYPLVLPNSVKEMNNHPTLSWSISRVKDDSHGVVYIKYATILLQEMTVELDEDFLFALIDFAKLPGISEAPRDHLCDSRVAIPLPQPVDLDSDLYFEGLHLQPTQLNLSFVRTERMNADDRADSGNALMFFFNMLTMAIGNINDAPIKLNALLLTNVRVPLPLLVHSVLTHYGQDFIYQIHKVLGSADFLGNPVGLFNNLSSGVLDIFYEPYQGLIMNDRPQELGIGLAKGGLSFMKKSVFGFSDSFAKVSGSVAKGLTVATLDRTFQEQRRLNQRRNKPKHALSGFTYGATSLFDGLASGITGIALAPIEGATKEGAFGFLKGIGKGIVGLPTKTAIGFFDMASNVSEGIRNTTTVFDDEGLDRVRLPRHVGHDGIVRPYSPREAQGQYWLKTCNGGEFFGDEYLAHIVLAGEQLAVLVTFTHILLVLVGTLDTRWVITYDKIKSISLETTGVKVGLKGNKAGPFIPLADAASRKFLYTKIGVAVREYNKKCDVVV